MEQPIRIQEVFTPAFLVDEDAVKRNTERMRERCQLLGVELRPHMKTHKTMEAAVLATGGTRRKISVSTLKEAEFFADNGFDDILYAYPVTADKLPRCMKLLKRLDKFLVLFENAEALRVLTAAERPQGKKWTALLELDTGLGRTGIKWDDNAAVTLARAACENKTVDFEGLYVHCGYSYQCTSEAEMSSCNQATLEKILAVTERLKNAGIVCRTLGTGSTPACSRPIPEFSRLTELHPGNYIFNDYMQLLLGSCEERDVACCVATRVVSHRVDLDQMTVDCGFLALGHDGMQTTRPPGVGFCFIKDHPELELVGMTQELGKIKSKDGHKLDFSKFPIGTMLFILPWHSCLTAALHEVYYVHDGKNITSTWKPVRGW